MLRRIAQLRIIPVVEIEPGMFRKTELPMPSGSRSEQPAAWDRYWRESLLEGGLALQPLAPGSWCVDLGQLTEPAVIRACALQAGYLAEVLDELQNAERLEELVPALSGGYAIMDGSDVLWEPGCCGCLADFAVWETLLEANGLANEQLCHGTMSCEPHGEMLRFAFIDESESEPVAIFEAERRAWVEALAVAQRQVVAFRVPLMLALKHDVRAELLDDVAFRLTALAH